MKSNDLIDIIGEAADEHIRDAKTAKRKPNQWVRWVAAAASFCLVAAGAWNTLDRLDYHFFTAGCSAWPGEFVDGDYYYYVQHKGVMRYTPEGESEHLLHTYWFEEWDVNEYGIYYWWDMSVYVRDHETGTRTKLYTASRQDTTHIRFTLLDNGNVVVTHYNKNTDVTYEVMIDGRTGEVLDTVMEPTSYDVSRYAYWSRLNFFVGDRHIELVPVDEARNRCLLTENGQNLLPEGMLVSPESDPDYFGGALWLTVRSDGNYDPGEITQYVVIYPDGGTDVVVLPNDYYCGGTTKYLFTVNNNCAVLCVEVATGDSWLLDMDAKGDFHDLATDGVYLFTTAPWDHVQTCWKLVFDDSGRPTGLTLISEDVTPE